MKKISKFITDYLHWFIIVGVAALCTTFLIVGNTSENGSITLDGKDAVITEDTKQWVEDANEALARVMNTAATDEETIKANDEPMGQGFYVDIDTILSRILPDGHNDNGNGWQCSRYTGYLATGKWSYSSAHPDYGPVNGKNVAQYLVDNYGFKYISEPVKGAIGSGGFNTPYGHTALYLYSTGTNTAMVSDANWKPLTVATHNMNIAGWVWVVPGNYAPQPSPEPVPEPQPVEGDITYTVKPGDTLGAILRGQGYTGNKLFGDDGLAQTVASENKIVWRGLIYPGQTITIKREYLK